MNRADFLITVTLNSVQGPWMLKQAQHDRKMG